MKTEPVLYSFRRCPFAIRARMALAYSDVNVQHREVKLSDLPEAMLKISPKATVPVLQLIDGKVLEESLDIIDWSLQQNDPDDWHTRTDQALITENDEVFKPLLDKYKYADRNPELSQPAHRANCLFFLEQLEQRFESAGFLCGDRTGKADIAIMPFIRQFAGVEPGWFAQCQFISTRSWLNRILSSELFQTVMKKRPVWQPDDKAVYL